MSPLLCIFALLVVTSDAVAQSSADPNLARVQNEIRNLTRQLNEAALKRDRAALESIDAPEFIWIHAYGYFDDRVTQIDQTLRRATDAPFPLPLPSFDPPNQLFVFGDVAVFRWWGKTDDGSPALMTTIYAKRDGRFQIIQIQGTEMQPERQWVTLPDATLDAYAGRYRGPNAFAVIKREGTTLVADVLGTRLVLKPTSDNVFFDKRGGEWTFYREQDGRVAYYVWRGRGQERRATKVE